MTFAQPKSLSMFRFAQKPIVFSAAVSLGCLLAWTPAFAADGIVRYMRMADGPLQAIGLDDTALQENIPVKLGARLNAGAPLSTQHLVFAIRDAASANFDAGHRDGFTIPAGASELTAFARLPKGDYTMQLAYQRDGVWTTLGHPFAFIVSPDPSVTRPLGRDANWTYRFGDEFIGAAIDWSRWSDFNHVAEPDEGRGNYSNGQLEWNRGANCSVRRGRVYMTAKREYIVSESGRAYNWTSCLLSSHAHYNFRYGFIEARIKMPTVSGFWPAFWTYQAPGMDRWNETDVFEYYANDRTRLYHNQFAGAASNCISRPAFDPAAGFHVYGADIAPDGVRFYVDGVEVCRSDIASQTLTSIIINNFVFARIPPAAGTHSAVLEVDYVRAWQRP